MSRIPPKPGGTGGGSAGQGLTLNGSALDVDLITGKAGGQEIKFDTASGATTGKITSTAHATKGKWFLNDAGTITVDEANVRLGIGTASPSYPLTIIPPTAATNAFGVTLAGNGLSATTFADSNATWAHGIGAYALADGHLFWLQGTLALVLSKTIHGLYLGSTVGGDITTTTLLFVKATQTIASAAGATYDAQMFAPSTVTLSGSTNITTATGFNAANFAAPTYTSGSAVVISAAATVRISGAPIAAGSTTITKGYSLWLDAGTPRFDSSTANGAVATVLGSVGPVGSSTTVQEWLTIDINGTTRYLPCF